MFVPLDLTHADDGYDPPSFGIKQLCAELEKAFPAAIKPILQARMRAEGDPIRASCEPLIRGYAATMAGTGAVPVPLVGVGGLIGGIALMLRALANRYGVVWTPASFAVFVGALGTTTLLWFAIKYGLRELLKLLPAWGTVVGGTVNAAAAFALTYSMGAAACRFLWGEKIGQAVPAPEILREFEQALWANVKNSRHQGAEKE